MTQLYELICSDAFNIVTGGQHERWDCYTQLAPYSLTIDGYIKFKDIEAMLMGGCSIDAPNYIPSGFSTLLFETINREEV